MSGEVRLQKYLSAAGRASRREAERLMLAGRVRVNGDVAAELGTKVTPGRDVVTVDGEPVEQASKRWVAFHKPSGILTTRSDPHGGRTVYDLLPEDQAGLRYVGRLDRDAEGLLLLTNDGDTAHALQHPSGEVEREYWLEVAGSVERSAVHDLVGGVALDDGVAKAKRVEILEAGEVTSRLSLVLTEGRKREVRRMLSAVGHPVLRLRRTRYGPVALGNLTRGAWRELEAREVAAVVRAATGRARG
jgi:23S rRNA pseudouridine2605 synthase